MPKRRKPLKWEVSFLLIQLDRRGRAIFFQPLPAGGELIPALGPKIASRHTGRTIVSGGCGTDILLRE